MGEKTREVVEREDVGRKTGEGVGEIGWETGERGSRVREGDG